MVHIFWEFSNDSDYNYRLKDGKCELIGSERIISGHCDAPGDRYKASSGYRKIPGNTCIEPSSNRKDDPVDKECGKDGVAKPRPPVQPGTITHVEHPFVGRIQYFYLERSETSSGDDETVLMHVGGNKLYISRD